MSNQIQAIEWPKAILGGREFTFRLSYAAYVQLARWGKSVATATVLELGAACAGNFDAAGKWRSEGFDRPIDLADIMESQDESKLSDAVVAALKKVLPEAEVSLQPIPAEVAAT